MLKNKQNPENNSIPVKLTEKQFVGSSTGAIV